jgi:hypothetical protein
MIYLFTILAAFLIASSTYAKMGISTTMPYASAQLEVSSTTKRVFAAKNDTRRTRFNNGTSGRISSLVYRLCYWRRVASLLSNGLPFC